MNKAWLGEKENASTDFLPVTDKVVDKSKLKHTAKGETNGKSANCIRELVFVYLGRRRCPYRDFITFFLDGSGHLLYVNRNT